MLIPEASSSALHVDRAFYLILGISAALLLIVTGAMLYFVFRYRRRNGATPEQLEGSTALEIIWTVIPVVLVLVMFVVGERSFVLIRAVPHEFMQVKVEARQWSWVFSYEDGRKSDTLRVPRDRPVKLLLTSADVLHSFYIPAFRIKEDCVPGMDTYLSFTAKQSGSFDIFCTEYCGLGHSDMIAKVQVDEADAFDKWYAAAPARAAGGEQLLKEKGCLGCHSTDGTPKAGPTLKDLYGHRMVVITGGRERSVTADEDYIRRSILDPGADVVKGFPAIMPKIQMTKEELDAIVAYLEHLK